MITINKFLKQKKRQLITKELDSDYQIINLPPVPSQSGLTTTLLVDGLVQQFLGEK